MTFMSLLYFSSLTPMTNMGASAEGAEITTLWAPPVRWADALSMVVKIPVDSTTMVTPSDPQGMVDGSRLRRWM